MLRDALSGLPPIDRILLKAAAGAGKSFALKRLVAEAVDHPRCDRVGDRRLHEQADPPARGVDLGRQPR